MSTAAQNADMSVSLPTGFTRTAESRRGESFGPWPGEKQKRAVGQTSHCAQKLPIPLPFIKSAEVADDTGLIGKSKLTPRL